MVARQEIPQEGSIVPLQESGDLRTLLNEWFNPDLLGQNGMADYIAKGLEERITAMGGIVPEGRTILIPARDLVARVVVLSKDQEMPREDPFHVYKLAAGEAIAGRLEAAAAFLIDELPRKLTPYNTPRNAILGVAHLMFVVQSGECPPGITIKDEGNDVVPNYETDFSTSPEKRVAMDHLQAGIILLAKELV